MSNLWTVPEELEDEANSPYAYEACKSASYILWALSGRKYNGIRTVTERYECPCRPTDSLIYGSTTISPYLDGSGAVLNAVATSGESDCGCSGTVGGSHTRLRLRGTPVRSVQQVKSASGTVLDSSEYKIVNGSLLQLSGSNANVCGLEVTYTYGVPIPTSGRRSARLLAGELSKGWGGKECMLPDGVTSVSRQGISFEIHDSQDYLNELRTGIYEIDLFLRAANPDKARKPARVYSPDKPKAHRVTVGAPTQIGPLDWGITPGQPYAWTVDASAAGLDLLFQTSLWAPQGQISMWNGSLLLDFDPSRFQIVGDMLTVNLTAQETSQVVLNGQSASWDLYAVNKNDNYTIVHLLTSSVWIVS